MTALYWLNIQEGKNHNGNKELLEYIQEESGFLTLRVYNMIDKLSTDNIILLLIYVPKLCWCFCMFWLDDSTISETSTGF